MTNSKKRQKRKNRKMVGSVEAIEVGTVPGMGGGELVRIEARELVAVHRYGGWPDGFTYPTNEQDAKRAHLPWRPRLVGRHYPNGPIGLRRFFREVLRYNSPPYHVLVTKYGPDGKTLPDWTAYQLAALDREVYHAKRWNVPALAVTVEGPWHRETPPAEAVLKAAEIVGQLLWGFGWEDPRALTAVRFGRLCSAAYRLDRHDRLDRGTSTPGKVCPGNIPVKGELAELARSVIGSMTGDNMAPPERLAVLARMGWDVGSYAPID